MGLFDWLGLADSLVNGYNKVNDSNNKRDIEIARIQNREKTNRAKVYTAGGVAAVGIAALAAVMLKKKSTKITTTMGTIEVSDEPKLSIDSDSVWLNRQRNQFGGNVIDPNTGKTYEVVYQPRKINGKSYRIYEYNGDEWVPGKIVDLSDKNSLANGGAVFARIAEKALRLAR